MKNLTVKTKFTAADFYKPETVATIREIVKEVLVSIEESRQKCFILGQMLCEAKAVLVHGEFQEWVKTNFPEICYETANRYAKAAQNIFQALPAPAVEMQISQVLTLPDESLTAAEQKFKQLWFDFTKDKSVGAAMKGSFLDNDPAIGLLRGTNGRLMGGKGGKHAPDRKSFEKFVATKLGHITTFLTVSKKTVANGRKQVVGFRELPETQRAAIVMAFTGSMEKWPDWLLAAIADKSRTELKLTNEQRLARL